jgi:hypothetical protein
MLKLIQYLELQVICENCVLSGNQVGRRVVVLGLSWWRMAG